jgi:hypothetical protein
MRPVVVGFSLVVVVGACVFDDRLPAEPLIVCTTSADCPRGFECRDAIARCIRTPLDDATPAGFAAPPLVTPAVARAGTIIEARFEATEALARPPSVLLAHTSGGAPFIQEPSSGADHVYRYAVTGAEGEGNAAVLVELVDARGNIASALLAGTVKLDLTAPSVTGSEVRALGPTGSGEEVGGLLIVGGVLEVEIVVSELDATAAASLRPLAGDVELPLTPLPVPGFEIRAFREVIGVLAAGEYEVVVELADPAGNERTQRIGRVTMVDTVPSPCVARDASGAAVCTDFDDDGFFGASAGCPLADDCHDNDPLTHPGAPEIPGDGADNDCGRDGDLPLEAITAIYLAPDGDDEASGSRVAPLATLEAAVARASLEGAQAIVAVAGDYLETAPMTIAVPVFGGRERGTWAPALTGARSRFGFARSCADFFVTVDGQATMLDAVAVEADCAVATVRIIGAAPVMRRVQIENAVGSALLIAGSAAGVTRIFESTLRTSSTEGAIRMRNPLTVHRSRIEGPFVSFDSESDEAHTTIVRSRIHGKLKIGRSSVRLYSSIVTAGEANDTLVNAITGDIVIMASTLEGLQNGPVQLGRDGLTLIGGLHLVDSLVDAPRGVLLDLEGACTLEGVVAGLRYRAACDVEADDAGGNGRCVAPPLPLQDFIEVVDVEQVPAIELTRPLPGGVPLLERGAPTSIAGDVDGRCRDTSAPGYGAFAP